MAKFPPTLPSTGAPVPLSKAPSKAKAKAAGVRDAHEEALCSAYAGARSYVRQEDGQRWGLYTAWSGERQARERVANGASAAAEVKSALAWPA